MEQPQRNRPKAPCLCFAEGINSPLKNTFASTSTHRRHFRGARHTNRSCDSNVKKKNHQHCKTQVPTVTHQPLMVLLRVCVVSPNHWTYCRLCCVCYWSGKKSQTRQSYFFNMMSLHFQSSWFISKVHWEPPVLSSPDEHFRRVWERFRISCRSLSRKTRIEVRPGWNLLYHIKEPQLRLDRRLPLVEARC